MAGTLVIFKVDECFFEMLTQNSIYAVNLLSPHTNTFIRFTIPVSGDPVSRNSDHTGMELVLSTDGEGTVRLDLSRQSF